MLLLFVVGIPFNSLCQLNLTIEIVGLRNSTGQILVEFCNEQGATIKGINQTIMENKCTVMVENLLPGKYAFKYFHDENTNKELDTNWIGIPTEGFGFSNNATGTIGPPSFEKTIFVIKENTTLKCTPTYY